MPFEHNSIRLDMRKKNWHPLGTDATHQEIMSSAILNSPVKNFEPRHSFDLVESCPKVDVKMTKQSGQKSLRKTSLGHAHNQGDSVGSNCIAESRQVVEPRPKKPQRQSTYAEWPELVLDKFAVQLSCDSCALNESSHHSDEPATCNETSLSQVSTKIYLI